MCCHRDAVGRLLDDNILVVIIRSGGCRATNQDAT
jgi:hypothetical protein